MRFVDIDEEEHGPSLETVRAIGIEAQEAANQALYERALRLQSDRSVLEAAELYRQLLAQQLVAEAPTDDVGDGDDDAHLARQPSLLLRSLALKNLALIESEAGDHQAALLRLLVAVQIQRRDGVLWHRLGSLAQKTGQSHLARFALEQATRCSPHLQLGQRSLSQLLASVGDTPALEQLHATARRTQPHLAAARRAGAAAGGVRIDAEAAAAAVATDSTIAEASSVGACAAEGCELVLSALSWAAVADGLCALWTAAHDDEATAAAIVGRRVVLLPPPPPPTPTLRPPPPVSAEQLGVSSEVGEGEGEGGREGGGEDDASAPAMADEE
eukprot:5543517-Prymnesium_polylepis.1